MIIVKSILLKLKMMLNRFFINKKVFSLLILMFFIVWNQNVNEVDTLVNELFLSNKKNGYIAEQVYDKCFHSGIKRDKNIKVKFDLKRKLAIHNFFNGYIWYEYSCVENRNEKMESGSWKIDYRVKIKKINGKWNIIDSFEKP